MVPRWAVGVSFVLVLVLVVSVWIGLPGGNGGDSVGDYKTIYVNDSLDIFVRSDFESRVSVNLIRNSTNETVLAETRLVNGSNPAEFRNVTNRVGVYTLEVRTEELEENKVVEVCQGRGSVRVVIGRDEIEVVQGHIDYFTREKDFVCKLES